MNNTSTENNIYLKKYKKYKNKYLQLNSLMMTGGNSNQNELMLFKADWCGHCKSFLPVWEKISKDNNLNISFKTFDSDKNKSDINKYNIQGFPTIIYKVNDQLIEYNGSRDEKSIIDFITKYDKN